MTRNKYLSISFTIFLIFLLVIFLIRVTQYITSVCSDFDPILGEVSLYVLLIFYFIILIIPIIIFITKPKPLEHPGDENSQEYDIYFEKVTKRLSKNPELKGFDRPLRNIEDVKEALKVLDSRANRIISKSAITTFITTGLSRSGKFDAFIVLFAQVRLVWIIAHLYNQSPTLLEMLRLYRNVIYITLIAYTVEEISIEDLIMDSLPEAITGSINSIGHITEVTSGFADGGINAFSITRTGIITKKMVNYSKKLRKNEIRRIALTEAFKLYGSEIKFAINKIKNSVLAKKTNSMINKPKNAIKDSFNEKKYKIQSRDYVTKIFPNSENLIHGVCEKIIEIYNKENLQYQIIELPGKVIIQGMKKSKNIDKADLYLAINVQLEEFYGDLHVIIGGGIWSDKIEIDSKLIKLKIPNKLWSTPFGKHLRNKLIKNLDKKITEYISNMEE